MSKRSIAESKARLDDEMRAYAAALKATGCNGPREVSAALRLRFPAIHPPYADELAGV